MTDLLTLDDVAATLGCSRATVKRRVRSGELPAFRDGRLVRVRACDLDRYVIARVERAVPAAPGATLAGATVPAGGRLWD